MNTSNWKMTPPAEPGLYIASTCKDAGTVRYFKANGKWSVPLSVRDMHLTERIPGPHSNDAKPFPVQAIEWLDAFGISADGWVVWSRLHDESPVPPATLVYVRLRDGSGQGPASAAIYTWGPLPAIPLSEILAYRVVPEATAAPGVKPSNPKDLVGVRKAPMSTVSAVVMAEVGVAMLEGAAKYGRHNYRAVGVRSSVYYDGTMRHLMAWWEGQDLDPDSGMSHITKAITSLVVLRDAMIQGKCEDDRAPRSAEFYTALNTMAGEIIDKHADKTPRHYTIGDAA